MKQYRDLERVALMILALVVIGATGHHILEGWPWLDSLCMTVITLATVGFKEVGDMDTAGRVFTIILIMGGVSVLGYGATQMTSFVVEGRINEALKGRRMERTIERLEDHYIVCGFGRIGSVVAEELVDSGFDVVVVDNEEHPDGITIKDRDIPVIVGDATDDEVLLKAGIERAKGLATALPGDPRRAYQDRTGAIVLAVRRLNGETVNNPSGDYVMAAWEKLIAMGKPDQLDALEKLAEG